MQQINIKRVSDPLELHDGVRILIDRLWPRGIKKSEGHIDSWLKDIAPSSELRRFFNHDRQKWAIFKQHYIEELKHKKDLIDKLSRELNKSNVTLLYNARDRECNNAIVLKEYLTDINNIA